MKGCYWFSSDDGDADVCVISLVLVLACISIIYTPDWLVGI